MSNAIDNNTPQIIGDEMFDLYGVVVHMGGGCRSGHYFSYCKGFDGEWYDCNDDFVQRA
jgi:ubiquitin C-terminal hydrolase